MTLRYAALAAITLLAAGSAQAEGTLDKIKETGTIALGYRESSVPFSFLGPDQKPIGISIDLCDQIIDAVKAALPGTEIKASWVPVNASNRIPLLQNGTIDLECGSTTNTASRQTQVAFSVATFASQVTWAVKKDSGIASEAALKGKTVVVTQGSLNAEVLEKLNASEGLGLSIQRGKEQAESLALLNMGRASAWFEDDILQAGLVALSPKGDGITFIKSGYPAVSYYGIMLRKDDDAFKKVVDDKIGALMADGEYTKLYDKWFAAPIPPEGKSLNLPMSDALKARVAHPSDALAD